MATSGNFVGIDGTHTERDHMRFAARKLVGLFPPGLWPGGFFGREKKCLPGSIPWGIFPCFIELRICRASGTDRNGEGVIVLPGVYLEETDNFDISLRRFKKQVEKAGILSELKKRQHYEKPSVMRKKKKAAARKRLLKKMRKINMM